MALWKTRPSLRLLAPSRVHVGEPFTVTLEVEAAEPVEVEWIDLTLEAFEGWVVGAGKSRVARVHRYPHLVARLATETTLSGVSRFVGEFQIPAIQPPSRNASVAYVRYAFLAQASIPWWPDARATFPLTVRGPAMNAAAQPVVVAPSASELFEVSLDSQRIATEGVVGGLIAMKKAWSGPPVVDVTLREVLRLVSWNGFERVRRGAGFTVSVTLPTELGGKAPFKFSFGDVPPTFAAATFRHEWELVIAPRSGSLLSAMAGVFSDSSLQVPVVVVESPSLAAVSPTLVAPSVGDTRLAELLAAAASTRPAWTLEGLGLERTVDAPFGRVEVRLEWVPGASQTVLRATIEPPALGLGLRVSAAGALDVFVSDVSVGVADWDRRHKVVAREAGQAAAFLGPIALAAQGLSMVATDESLTLERPDAAMSAASLTAFIDEIDLVLAEIPAALGAIPPPSGTSVDRTEAIRLAHTHRGTFHPGDLALRGLLDDRSFEATLLFEGGRVMGQRLSLGPVPEATLHVGPGRDAASLAAVPEAVRPMIAALPSAVTIAIENGAGVVHVAAVPGRPFAVDHGRTVSLAGLVVMLARSLGPDRGPFR